MKLRSNLINRVLIGTVFILGSSLSVFSQYFLNEIEIDPPAVGNDACQYIEIKGPAGATVPAGTYFLSVNSDAGNFGFANQAINFGGLVVGSNGTITLHNNFSGGCPNRTYPTQTTLLEYNLPLFIGGGSETYLVVQTASSLFSGQDLDTNDDGVFDLAITVLDGFALLVNPKEEYVYGAAAGAVNVSNTTAIDQPDAVTRFRANTTPFAAAAFYFGELAGTPDETLEYANPRSPNFPTGGVLTPGAANAPASQPAVRSPFDFDGDSKTDIGIFRPLGAASEWWVNRSSTGITFALQFGASTDRIAPADYTGDGKADIAFFRPSSGEWYVLRSEDFSFFALPFGTNGDVPVPADYDADGKADFAVFRPSISTWFISQSSGAPTQIVQFGINGDQPVVADYDGDGKADVAIFRPAPAEWWIQRSTAGLLALQFGTTTDKVVQGDYTGDGKADVAIWRPSSGDWFIVRSEDLSFFGFPFGASGDTVAPGDYDGDGKFDPTLFRPSSATWFIARSTAGTQIVPFGATGDRPIPNAFVP